MKYCRGLKSFLQWKNSESKLALVVAVLLVSVFLMAFFIQARGSGNSSSETLEDSLKGGDYGLRLLSSPSGADVVIDGNWYGTTPLYLKLEEGNHQIKFRREYFETKEKELHLDSPTTVECQLVLEKDISREIPLLVSISHYRMSGNPPSPEIVEPSSLRGKMIEYLEKRGFTVLNPEDSPRLFNGGKIKEIIENGNMEPIKELSEKYAKAEFLIIGESFNTSQENPNPNFDGFTVRGRVELWLLNLSDYSFLTSKGMRLSVVSRDEWTIESLVLSGKESINYFIERITDHQYISSNIQNKDENG
ncbi:MAG: PEGA domain-containing protein [Candidatus Paceibacterota bacterium]